MNEVTANEYTEPSIAEVAGGHSVVDCNPVRISVAFLANREIERMNAADLIDVIQVANLPPITAEIGRGLQWKSEEQLRRMAHLTRLACRHWVNATREKHHLAKIFLED